MEQVVAENGFRKAELLSAVNDEHGGVIVELKEHMDPNVFLTLLRASILQWKLQVYYSNHFPCVNLAWLIYLIFAYQKLFEFSCLT